ncbi:MAG: hypothetical protein ABIA92_02730 [Patescibacteria group bacterium]
MISEYCRSKKNVVQPVLSLHISFEDKPHTDFGVQVCPEGEDLMSSMNCPTVTGGGTSHETLKNLAESIAAAGGEPEKVFVSIRQGKQFCATAGRALASLRPFPLKCPEKRCHHPISVDVEGDKSPPGRLRMPADFGDIKMHLGHMTVMRSKVLSYMVVGCNVSGNVARSLIAKGDSWDSGSYYDLLGYLKAESAFPTYAWKPDVRFYALGGDCEGNVCYVQGEELIVCKLTDEIPAGSWIVVWA